MKTSSVQSKESWWKKYLYNVLLFLICGLFIYYYAGWERALQLMAILMSFLGMFYGVWRILILAVDLIGDKSWTVNRGTAVARLLLIPVLTILGSVGVVVGLIYLARPEEVFRGTMFFVATSSLIALVTFAFSWYVGRKNT